MTARLIHGDCLLEMAKMPECSVDSIVTDPPYGLSFMGRKWDYDVPSVEIWAECLRILKPGGHLLTFAGTRTQHRMAVRIEDAGFEIRDMIAWVYGSGFPKSHNGPWGGTALKPAMEPITVARKPLVGTVAENVLVHGTGGLNIDGCRVETADNLNGGAYATRGGRTESQSLHVGSGMNRPGKTTGKAFIPPAGRWPANLIHDGGCEVNSLLGSAARFFYCAKASKKDRDEGCDKIRASFSPKGNHAGRDLDNPKNHLGGLQGSVQKNNHPTVKPTDLMRYLCRLVTPAGGTVLDPFMGSGSTGKAALLEGFEFIGIEREQEYMKIAEARIGAFDFLG